MATELTWCIHTYSDRHTDRQRNIYTDTHGLQDSD